VAAQAPVGLAVDAAVGGLAAVENHIPDRAQPLLQAADPLRLIGAHRRPQPLQAAAAEQQQQAVAPRQHGRHHQRDPGIEHQQHPG
jgi:hypothetical protein